LGTMRRRNRSYATKRRRGIRPRYEVSQTSRRATASIANGGTSANDPFTFSFYLLGQLGLMRTGQRDVEVEQPPNWVLDSSVRGVSIREIVYNFDVHRSPDFNEDNSSSRYTVEVADCLYVDDIQTADIAGQDAPMITNILPDHFPNLYMNQIGEQTLGLAKPSAGAFNDVFNSPDRILFRRWGSLDCMDVPTSNPTLLTFAPPESLKYLSPVDYAMKRIKRRAFLGDDQGLFQAVNMINHGPQSVDLVINVDAIVVYRVVR